MQAKWRHLLICGCLASFLGVSEHSLAAQRQEPEEIPSVLSPRTSATLIAPGSTDEDRWRYLNHEGRWWYWLPSNRWVVWVDGRWVDPPTRAIGSRPYVMPAPPRPVLAPRPRSWYYTGRTYDGPAYYYDEFYEPYGTHSTYPVYPRYGYPYGYHHGHHHHYHHGGHHHSHPDVRVRGTIGGGSSRVRVGVGF